MLDNKATNANFLEHIAVQAATIMDTEPSTTKLKNNIYCDNNNKKYQETKITLHLCTRLYR